jgi:hypothetical protein
MRRRPVLPPMWAYFLLAAAGVALVLIREAVRWLSEQ